jgi:hypothetical protein
VGVPSKKQQIAGTVLWTCVVNISSWLTSTKWYLPVQGFFPPNIGVWLEVEGDTELGDGEVETASFSLGRVWHRLEYVERMKRWAHFHTLIDRNKMLPNIEVKQIDEKQWGMYVNGVLIGTSKGRFDADHAKVMLEKALTNGGTNKQPS